MAMIAMTIISSINVNPVRRDMSECSSLVRRSPDDSRRREGTVHGFDPTGTPAERFSGAHADESGGGVSRQTIGSNARRRGPAIEPAPHPVPDPSDAIHFFGPTTEQR
jgi:hypothetical protein